MTKVITYGTFDLFHEGHYNLLKRAKQLGDYLIVGITTEHYDEERGKINVVDSLLERIDNVRKSGLADEIVIEYHEGQKLEDIQKFGIDIFVVGSDWSGTFDYIKDFCKLVYLERTPDISSSLLRESKYPIIRIGVVGTGRIAPRFIAEAKYVSGVNVRCAYNPHYFSAQNFQEKYDLECMNGAFEDFLDKVDAVYIASPHETHYDYAKRALSKGKYVLCEKPLAFTKDKAKELLQLAEKHNTILMEGIKTAFCPGFNQIVNMVKSGKIGEVKDIEACFSRLTDPKLREMEDEEFGGAFMEFGSHTMLPIIKLLGTEYKKVQFESILASNGIDLYTKVYFRYEDGLAMSKTGVGVKSEGQLLISGTKGYILVQSPWWLTRKFDVCFEDFRATEHYNTKFLGDGLRYEICEFASVIHKHGGKNYKLTNDESIAMAGVVEEFLEIRKKQRQEKYLKNISADMEIWAHRGCSYAYPENTLAAFEAACKLETITGIELEIQQTKDDQVIVFHDDTIQRLMNGKGFVKDYTLVELQTFGFVDYRTGGVIEGLKIPTIQEVFEVIQKYKVNPDLMLNIELKPYKDDQKMENLIIELIKKYKIEEHIILSSFDVESLKYIHQVESGFQTAILASEYQEAMDKIQESSANGIHIDLEKVDDQTKINSRLSIRVYNRFEPFYGCKNRIKTMDLSKLKEIGIDAIFTNIPEKYI